MADLEDFFAKRDKKKKSKKFDTVDIDDVAKVLDAKAKERKKLEVYQPQEGETTNDHGAKEDDDWKEIPDDTPDFTGLKIQEFSLAEEEEAQAKEAEIREANDKDHEGPWKMKKSGKSEKAEVPAPVAAPAPAPVEKPAIIEVKAEKLQSESPEPEPKSLGSEKDDKDETGSQKSDADGKSTPTSSEGPQPVKYLTPAQKRRLAEEAAMGAKPAAATPAPRPAATPPTPSSVGPLASSGGKYVPPSQRFGASSVAIARANKPRKAAPNTESEEQFPSLSGGRS
jgi:hypothetical protein